MTTPLDDDWTNTTPNQDKHPGQHNAIAEAINALLPRVEALEAGGGGGGGEGDPIVFQNLTFEALSGAGMVTSATNIEPGPGGSGGFLLSSVTNDDVIGRWSIRQDLGGPNTTIFAPDAAGLYEVQASATWAASNGPDVETQISLNVRSLDAPWDPEVVARSPLGTYSTQPQASIDDLIALPARSFVWLTAIGPNGIPFEDVSFRLRRAATTEDVIVPPVVGGIVDLTDIENRIAALEATAGGGGGGGGGGAPTDSARGTAAVFDAGVEGNIALEMAEASEAYTIVDGRLEVRDAGVYAISALAAAAPGFTGTMNTFALQTPVGTRIANFIPLLYGGTPMGLQACYDAVFKFNEGDFIQPGYLGSHGDLSMVIIDIVRIG